MQPLRNSLHVIIYLESTFLKLLEQTELSTIVLDNRDKFICLYTKMLMACSKDCSEDCIDLKRLDILKFFKENCLNAKPRLIKKIHEGIDNTCYAAILTNSN